jgi:hypothetical protein
MSIKSWLQQVEEQMVIHVPDERDRDVRDRAIRTGYIAGGLTALGLSAGREALTGQSGLIWPTLAIVLLPLLVPLGQRLLAGGLAPADERVRRLQRRAFRWACLLLMGGFGAFSVYRGVVLDDIHASWNFIIPMQAGGLAVFAARIRQDTLPGSARGWLVSAVLYLGTLMGIALLILMTAVMFGEPLSSSISIMLLLVGGIAAGYVVVCLWAARHRRRAEQAAQEDERQFTQTN